MKKLFVVGVAAVVLVGDDRQHVVSISPPSSVALIEVQIDCHVESQPRGSLFRVHICHVRLQQHVAA